MTTFCILTCTYNAEKELQRTLDSVRRQSYNNIRHIIVDGKSSDGTMTLATAYAERNAQEGSPHQVEVISEKDKGLYDAMNKAIGLAKGDYIVFLNAGDTLADNRTLENMAEQISQYPTEAKPGVVYGNTDIVNEKGIFLAHRRLQPPEVLTWKSFINGMLVCHQAFYARTDLAKETQYNTKYRFSADVDWCIRIMKLSAQKHLPLHNTHLVLCNYLDGGMTVQNHRASLMERFRVMSEHYGLLRTILAHMWFLIRK